MGKLWPFSLSQLPPDIPIRYNLIKNLGTHLLIFYKFTYRIFAIISRTCINFQNFLVRLLFENCRKSSQKHHKKPFWHGFYSNAAYNSKNTVFGEDLKFQKKSYSAFWGRMRVSFLFGIGWREKQNQRFHGRHLQ